MHSTDQLNTPTVATSENLRALYRAHAELCRALGHEHRIAILHAVCEEELCVGDLAAALGLPVHTVSQHLRVLREHQLVRARKDAQQVYYRLTNPKFMAACLLIREALVEQHQAEGASLLAADLLDARQAEPAALA